MTIECPLCASPEQKGGMSESGHWADCARCGRYSWDWTLREVAEPRPDLNVKLSAYVRQQNDMGQHPRLDLDIRNKIDSSPFPKTVDRAYTLLHLMVAEADRRLVPVDPMSSQHWKALTYSRNDTDIYMLIATLRGEGLVRSNIEACELTPAAFIRSEELASVRTASSQGFVAMAFDDVMLEAYREGLAPAIEDAGYKPMRIDNKEHIGGITDEILAEIRRSRFVVADYTLSKHGVYYEAGFAQGLGIPVFPTCRADGFDALHFDVRHINTLKWETPAGLHDALAKRISAVLGDGPERR